MKFLARALGFASIIAVSVLLSASVAAADVLVRFPAGCHRDQMNAVTSALKQGISLPVLGVSADKPPASAETPVPAVAAELLQRAEKAYEKLELRTALALLEGAEHRCLQKAPFEVCRGFLFNLNMVRGMAQLVLGGEVGDGGAQAFRSAHIADPTRVLDPRRYPPNVLRAFASAAAGLDGLDKGTLVLRAFPDRARFWIDGRAVHETAPALAPGRHVIEARMLGYESAYRLVEVLPDGTPPAPQTVRLTPMQDVPAWQTLVYAISDPGWLGNDPEVDHLLSRFGIDHVLLLSYLGSGEGRLAAALASREWRGVRPLPDVAMGSAEISGVFSDALRSALGIPAPSTVAETTAASPPQLSGPFDDDDDDFDDEEEGLSEVEVPSIQFGETDTLPGDPRIKPADVLKSPWFWLSVGLVTSIVTGVVVATQLND